MRPILITILFLSAACSVSAQQQLSENKVQMLARAQQNAIAIRIAPMHPTLWQLGNKYGYYLERFTVTRKGVVLKNRERILLTPSPMKPRPLSEWEKPSETNDLIAIAAQAIYGETFEIDTKSATVFDVYNKTKETESRFSFALLSADLSAESAQLSGLYYKDNTVKKDEKYLYRVYTNIPPNTLKVDTSFVFVGLDDYADLPQPKDVAAKFGDQTVLLRWDTKYIGDFYSAYWIERSDNGGPWKKISNLPVLNTYPDNDPNTTYYYQTDSIQNNIRYSYRIKGISAFGEDGPPSEAIEGSGGKALKETPAITSAKFQGMNQISLTWDFPAADGNLIKGFLIERSAKVSSEYKPISTLLPKTTRTFTDTKPLPTNYYKVRAIGNTGEEALSYPYMKQLEDSIPPTAPLDLKGKIDTTGVVTLSWKPNQENDLLGYRIFRSNFKNSEFSQITVSPVDTVSFNDLISLDNLTGKIYYKIQALDHHFNPSSYSQVLELEKPDKVPPVPPVIKNFKISNSGIIIQWINSSSEDVTKHVLHRRKAGTKDWETIKTILTPDTLRSHLDVPPTAEYYEYSLTSVDRNNLTSIHTPVVKGRLVIKSRPAIEKIKSDVDRQNKNIRLTWTYDEKNVTKIIIYRAEENGNPELYSSVAGIESRFTDAQVAMNTTYSYYLKAIFKDGVESAFSKPVVVKY